VHEAYLVVKFIHVVAVMFVFGVAVANDAVMIAARKRPDAASALYEVVRGRFLPIELVSGLVALLCGLALLGVNPAGMTIFKSGMWIHLKTTFGLLGIVLVLASRAGVGATEKKGWVSPVRGVGLLMMLLAAFSVIVLRAA
jgi:uncharacterized membrane protein